MSLYDFIKSAVTGHAAPDGVAIAKHVASLGLEVENLGVTVSNGTATATGLATDRAEASKIVMAIANTDGITHVDNQMRVPMSSIQPAAGAAVSDDHADEDKVQFVTVKAGDTLSAISQRVYGSANKYNTILEANKPMLTDADHIYPGQVLRIPAAA
jgi:nucleoid-associated protein YgaU